MILVAHERTTSLGEISAIGQPILFGIEQGDGMHRHNQLLICATSGTLTCAEPALEVSLDEGGSWFALKPHSSDLTAEVSGDLVPVAGICKFNILGLHDAQYRFCFSAGVVNVPVMILATVA
ncbi:hypothetical protein [Terriglobus roseus]|uniref:Uncharacterized protein n=1 Tax=Terriglobus roseus TaxID=392734 RepID=A0A1G7GDW6_9BACT|nr:hypothetical protein [Terriglobus roseus]SDE86281.1 hypothetical protein SAMN05444167_0660 [Terriglobus roseus]